MKLNQKLIDYGFERSKSDPCIYINRKSSIIIAIYVDDFLIFYRSEDELKKLKTYLNNTFPMKDLGEVKKCLGLNFTRSKDSIKLDQITYIEHILEKFGMENSKPTPTPMDPNQKLSINLVNEENSLVGKVPYQEAIGSLLYLANATRPDIAFAVNDLSRFNTNHSEPHWRAVKRVFRYLRGTTNLKLSFDANADMDITMYSDADWGSGNDSRRSCSGYVATMAGAAISWQSKRQPIVALSSTEAEYIALSAAVKEALWLKQLVSEINPSDDKTITIFCDNMSAIDLGRKEAYRPRSKHIDLRYHHIRDNIESKQIALSYVNTNHMTADSLTKAVYGCKTAYCRANMGLKVFLLKE